MIITGYHQYKELCERMNRDECILTPIFRDPYYHRVENTVLCVGITFTNYDTYIVSISHDDAPVYDTPTGTSLLLEIDAHILAYINNVTVPKKELSPYITSTHAQFGMFRDTNKIIPLAVWGKYLREYNTQLMKIINKYKYTIEQSAFQFTKDLHTTLQEIESSGLKIDPQQLRTHYDVKVLRYFKHNMVYSEYNVFTTTGRPSNRFGGINFSALNKSDGSRETFISRYPDGVLVQFDFEAYHLRLIADEHQITLPPESLHETLAKIYFNTDIVTEELYAASKQKTFEIMYGMSDETYNIELFKRIVELRRSFKNTKKPLVLPSGVTVEIHEPNPSKMFNYHVQSLEIVKTLPKLKTILKLLKDTGNNLILYTYDSILLDMQSFDTEILRTVVEILEENKKFPVRIHAGKNYNDITEIRL